MGNSPKPVRTWLPLKRIMRKLEWTPLKEWMKVKNTRRTTEAKTCNWGKDEQAKKCTTTHYLTFPHNTKDFNSYIFSDQVLSWYFSTTDHAHLIGYLSMNLEPNNKLA